MKHVRIRYSDIIFWIGATGVSYLVFTRVDRLICIFLTIAFVGIFLSATGRTRYINTRASPLKILVTVGAVFFSVLAIILIAFILFPWTSTSLMLSVSDTFFGTLLFDVFVSNKVVSLIISVVIAGLLWYARTRVK